ncbi:hypothetical protein N7447_004338 [Penicillium robsamsonii]|uniref:uncharacterized protein n=1 Tax=Penicillium robsamsonii TaxID=1792511 RepID=UPI002548CB21|nr:uncharacterized protein N7447_004338 [Penicillium robsamsonii]KAJ5827575.1 hypothetical protein N7447_004338 [Penicillium robsamsonii]
MQLSSFLFATIALSVSSAWAAQGATSDDATCLRICRDDPIDCQAGWIPSQIAAEGEEKPCWTCCNK